jgi:hypothetical protein
VANTSDDAIAQRATWVCHASATDQVARSPGAIKSPTGRVISLPAPLAADVQGCGGFAVLEKSWAGPVRELALLVLGILISLATARLPRLRKTKSDTVTPPKSGSALAAAVAPGAGQPPEEPGA